MRRAVPAVLVAVITVGSPAGANRNAAFQQRTVAEVGAQLSAADPSVRAQAACELKEHGDAAGAALASLIALLPDGAPVETTVCPRRWWSGNQPDLTTPGQLAAAALVAIGSRAFDPLLATLRHPAWIARRNAAWALGALDDSRAVPALVSALKDSEPAVREQAAWALGALDDRSSFAPLVAALDDGDARVRQKAAWALGAIGDSRGIAALLPALKDPDAGVRRQAAWAIGAIGR